MNAVFLPLLLAAPASAQQGQASSDTGAPFSLGIVNGEVEEGFPAVVALGVSAGSLTFSACTGSVITPRVVLTAAHCGEDIPLELVVKAGVAFFGTDIMEPDALVGFQDMALHPDYVPLESGLGGTELGENDIAVLVLEEDAPVEPLRLYTGALSAEEHEGQPLKSVGFGLTGNSAADTSGTKRSVDLVLDELGPVYVVAYADSAPTQGTICSGDSGGPQLMRLQEGGEWHQIAVHSWGDTGCRDRGGSTRVDVPLEWILDQVEAVHGSRDLCEINGNYDDGVCDEWCQGADPDCVVDTGGGEYLGGCAASPGRPVLALSGLAVGLLGLRRRRR